MCFFFFDGSKSRFCFVLVYKRRFHLLLLDTVVILLFIVLLWSRFTYNFLCLTHTYLPTRVDAAFVVVVVLQHVRLVSVFFLLKFIYYLAAGRRLLARAVVTISSPVVAIRVQLDLIGEFVVEFDLTLLG